ncbi:hypothetical protein BO71DRAFT_421748 [Aspergillus ellipticus CBS 707.79]|uniref:Uncharacterized protein n=1 Tax=Aspergillus ellipticus CBS 707.79 TaxID=1448320 RepID=A0A319D0U2_9EURO|nr:hypothetical protein BO71DRAFT_421748 [Aspergillus ellipticus CBS 707.79]
MCYEILRQPSSFNFGVSINLAIYLYPNDKTMKVYHQNNKVPDTSRLVVGLDGSRTIWPESEDESYYFIVSLRRLQENDDMKDINRLCWLRWSPSLDPGRGNLILLHHDPESNILQRIGVEEQPRYSLHPRIQQFPNEPSSSYTTEAKDNHDRCKVTHRLSFPDTWIKLLQPGHTYDLRWTGEGISHWDWGMQPDMGHEPKWPPVLVPVPLTFTVEKGERPPIPRPATPPPIQASERVPGAPVLSLELSCSPTITLTGRLEVHIRVIYHSLSDSNNTTTIGDENSRPIAFHNHVFNPLNREFRIYRRRCTDQSSPETEEEWEAFYEDIVCHFGIWDNPEKLINVSENPNGRFPTLFPGESWSNSWTMMAEWDLPEDLKPGERLRYQLRGNTLNWWDWGTAEAHTQTIVTLPGSGLEPISHPRDNGGRPNVVVPASNVVECTVIDHE